MFFCRKCQTEHDWPESLFRSQGRCEVCGQSALCFDVPSARLPLPPGVAETDISELLAEMEANSRYWLRPTGEAWREVTRDDFIAAERQAGFRPHVGDGLATGGFSSSTYGQGRITIGEINSASYAHDPNFLAVALSSPV